MTNTYNYRTATTADTEQLSQVALLANGTFAEVLGKEHWHTMEANLKNEQTYTKLLGIAECFVCEHEEKIVGMAFLISKGHPTDIFDREWSYIRLVAVHPEHRGKGIGKHLTQLCIAHASQTGEKILALHTSEFQDAARHIYEGLGFKRIKELDPIFGKQYFLYTLHFNE